MRALAFHLRRMPPETTSRAGLSDVDYAHLLAHVLRVNGLPPGDRPLRTDEAQLAAMIPGADAAEPFDPLSPSPDQDGARLVRTLPAVTGAQLRDPPPGDWLHWGRTYDGQSYSPLELIDRQNVHRLAPAWRAPLTHGSSMPMPLVHEGVMFLHTYPDTVIALDAARGRVLWRYTREVTTRSNKKMGLALHDDRIYFATSDLHVIALDIHTGTPVWEHALNLGAQTEKLPIFLRNAPLIAGDVVIQGVMSFRVPRGGYIIGIDRHTGEETWRFNTVAWPGQPGGHSWNGLPAQARNGGSVWHQGTYDPKLNLVYYGVAPTYDTAPLLNPSDIAGVTNDALFTNCTVALDPSDGKLVWHFQHTRNDQWDMDWVFERTLADLPTVGGGSIRAVMNIGKNAMLDALDAATGEFLFSLDSGVQNIIIAVDPETGVKTVDPTKLPNPDTAADICPVPFGARSWPQTSFSPATGMVYVPITESCFQMSETGAGGWLLTTGVNFGPSEHPGLRDGHMGRIQAIDVANRRLAWNTDLTTPPSTGVLSTAGGLVFAGDVSPALNAFDDETGRLLWTAPLDDTPSSSLITYTVKGTQYVAVVVGMTNNHVRDITRHYRSWSSTKGSPGDAGGASIWVFALPLGAR